MKNYLDVLFCWMMVAMLAMAGPAAGQTTVYGSPNIQWVNEKPVQGPGALPQYSNSPLVVLDERTEFHFYSSSNEKVTRYLRFLVNSEEGAKMLRQRKLPESFDPAFDEGQFKQGREAKIKTPFIVEYQVQSFQSRKYRANKWTAVQLKHTTENFKWIRQGGDFAGEFISDKIDVFELADLEKGDIVDIYYEANFNSAYGSNLFYINGPYPKLRCDYLFHYKVASQYAGLSFILPVNIHPAQIVKSSVEKKEHSIFTQAITLTDLPAINYPEHSFPGKKLPYVFADFAFYRKMNNSYPADGGRVMDFKYFRPANFEWMRFADTTNNYTKVYDKQSAAIRKFLSKMPALDRSDSSNLVFFKALCDTFNSFRFITSNHMFYNEPNLKDVYSGDHLHKRRLVEHLQWKLYRDILNESKSFYYVASLQDRRLGEHSTIVRANYAYERSLIAMPYKGSYIYFMPRYRGLKYQLNELPFYLEGSLANLSPRNFQPGDTAKTDKIFKFIRTHQGTHNENTRTENARIKVSLDSAMLRFNIKESLSGQFSTVLRPYYLNELIDSTISAHYFKRCSDKAGGVFSKPRLTSKISEYPFRYSFSTAGQIKQKTLDGGIGLRTWFSFVLNKQTIPVTPEHEYFFDFVFTDSYNFLLEFDKDVLIRNTEEFTKKVDNEYFALESGIVKNPDNTYLMKVQLAVKKRSVPLSEMQLLTSLLDELEKLDNYTLVLDQKN